VADVVVDGSEVELADVDLSDVDEVRLLRNVLAVDSRERLEDEELGKVVVLGAEVFVL